MFLENHILMVPHLLWFDLQFLKFMTVQKQYEFSRNYTLNIEFGYFSSNMLYNIPSPFLLAFINCTEGFHCDISIHAYNVL
jgi:hypothetical protein